MEQNPIRDRNRKIDALLAKFVAVLQENDAVIAALVAKQYKIDQQDVDQSNYQNEKETVSV